MPVPVVDVYQKVLVPVVASGTVTGTGYIEPVPRRDTSMTRPHDAMLDLTSHSQRSPSEPGKTVAADFSHVQGAGEFPVPVLISEKLQ